MKGGRRKEERKGPRMEGRRRGWGREARMEGSKEGSEGGRDKVTKTETDKERKDGKTKRRG